MLKLQEKTTKLMNSLKLIFCLFLFFANIALFLLVPGFLSPLAVVLSNCITLIIAFFAMKPLYNALKNESQTLKEETAQKEFEALKKQEEIESLRKKINELEDQIDTIEQVGYMPGNVNLTSKWICMEDLKSGYIVKELNINELPDDITQPAAYQLLRIGQNYNKVLYIHKYDNKVQIILDFQQIEYANDGDKLLLYGADIKQGDTVLSGDNNADSIERCLLLADRDGKVVAAKSIEMDADFKQFTTSFTKKQQQELDYGIKVEISKLGECATQKLHSLIEEKFKGRVQFVQEKRESLEWHYLSTAQDKRALMVGSMISFLSPNAINQAQIEAVDKAQPTIGDSY